MSQLSVLTSQTFCSSWYWLGSLVQFHLPESSAGAAQFSSWPLSLSGVSSVRVSLCSLSVLQDISVTKVAHVSALTLSTVLLTLGTNDCPKASLEKSTSRYYAVGIISLQHDGWVPKRTTSRE